MRMENESQGLGISSTTRSRLKGVEMKHHKIFKYEVEITDKFNFILPKGCEFLCCQMQQGKPFMWAKVPQGFPQGTDLQQEVYSFRVYGTGHPIYEYEGEMDYIDTFQTPTGLVFHLFKERNNRPT